jgi:hypothetical protein
MSNKSKIDEAYEKIMKSSKKGDSDDDKPRPYWAVRMDVTKYVNKDMFKKGSL